MIVEKQFVDRYTSEQPIRMIHGFSESMVLKLASRALSGHPEALAYRVFGRALDVALQAQDYFETSDPTSEFTKMLREVAQHSSASRHSEAIVLLQHSLNAETFKPEAENIYKIAIAQAYLDLNARAIADLEIHQVNSVPQTDLLRALHERYDTHYTNGFPMMNLEFSIAAEVAERTLLFAKSPHELGRVYNDLGSALEQLGGRESNSENLERAVGAYQSALQHWSIQEQPRLWAIAQSNLGDSLSLLSGRQNSTRQLEEALTAYQDALSATDKNSAPSRWGSIQNSLGILLGRIGERDKQVARFEDAKRAYEAALDAAAAGENTKLFWGMIKVNIAMLLETQHETVGGSSLNEAVAHMEDAMHTFTSLSSEPHITSAVAHIERLQRKLKND